MLLNRNNLSIAQFTSKEQSRYTLNGIQVTPNETVVTDGHQLVRVSTPTHVDETNYPCIAGFDPHLEEFNNFILPTDVAKTIEKAIPKDRNIPVLNHARVASNGSVQIAVTDLDNPQVFAPKPIPGQFPQWQAVMPTGTPAFEIFLNGELLAGLARAAAKYTDGKSVRLRFYGPTKAIRMDAVNDDGQTFTGILMPMRAEKCSSAYYGAADEAKAAEVPAET